MCSFILVELCVWLIQKPYTMILYDNDYDNGVAVCYKCWQRTNYIKPKISILYNFFVFSQIICSPHHN